MTNEKTVKIGIVHSKGGMGKSTLAFNIAYSLSKNGYKVGLIDFDPQASITKKFHNRYSEEENGIEPRFEYFSGFRVW